MDSLSPINWSLAGWEKCVFESLTGRFREMNIALERADEIEQCTLSYVLLIKTIAREDRIIVLFI